MCCQAELQIKASQTPHQALAGLEQRLNVASWRELLEYTYESSSFTPAWAKSISVLKSLACWSTHPYIIGMMSQ